MVGVPPPTSTVSHGHRRACSGKPPGQLSLPVDARGWGDNSGEDATARDLTVDEFSPVSAVLYFRLTDRWVSVDRGPWLSVCKIFDFLDLFHRFECMFQKFISLDRSVQFWWTNFFLVSYWSVVFDKNMRCTVFGIFLGE